MTLVSRGGGGGSTLKYESFGQPLKEEHKGEKINIMSEALCLERRISRQWDGQGSGTPRHNALSTAPL